MQKNLFPHQLKRCLGLQETITMTVGTVIGVGLFTVGANAVGEMGPMVLFATLSALLISIYPALLYAEMSSALPYAGGTYLYASLGLGRPWGMLAGWNFIISMISVASGEALAFSFYLRILFQTLGITIPFSDTIVACLAILFFLFLAFRGTKLSGRLQNGFLYFFWGVTIVWFFSMLSQFRPVYFAHLSGVSTDFWGFLPCVAMVWWCFAGFETCCALGEEIRHPQINLPRALFLAPFLVFAVTALFQWVLLCIVPPENLSVLATADAPYAQGMYLAGVTGFPLLLLCAGIAFGGDFSTLNASVAAPARYLFTMARDGVLPPCFVKLHSKYRTPWLAILLLGILMLLLVSTGSITYIASLSLFATLFYYIIGIAAAWGLRKKYPQLPRAYQAPKLHFGVPVSILLYLIMICQLQSTAILAGLLWSGLGLILYFYHHKKGKAKQNPFASLPPLPALPKSEERKQLNQTFQIWRNITILAVILVLSLYLGAFLLGSFA